MDPEDQSPLSALLRPPGETSDGLETDQLRAATRSALFGLGEESGEVRVGRFIVGALVGQGAMGTVFRAHDPDLGRDVALKALEPINDSEAATEALLGEARTLAQLNHANVVTVHECGVDRGRVYIAMEYIQGGTLADWLRRNPPEEPGRFERALDLATQAAAGLAAAHAVGLIHRDLKPNNMLVDAEGRLRLADFGLARPLEFASGLDITVHDESDPRPAWTRPAGTPGYVAPEQLAGKPTDASDQFSLCATFYEAFAGVLPFAGRTEPERLAAVRVGSFEAPGPSHDVPRWLRLLLERGLAERSEARFGSVQELLVALERGRTRPSRVRRVALGGAAVAALAGALVIPSLVRDEPADAAAVCIDGADRLAQVWGPQRAESTRSQVLSVGGAFSKDAWSRISESVETWGGQWVGEYQDACEATKVRGEQSTRAMELRMRCLDRQLVGVDATLERVGAMSLPAIVASLADGSRPIECRDVALLEATLQEPADPQSREEIDGILRALQKGELALLDAEHEPGLEVTTAAVERARALAHGPSLVAALILHAKLLRVNREPFEEAAREAVQLAAKHGLPGAETNAWLMVSLGADDHGDIIKRHSDTSVSLQAAQAAMVRAGAPVQLAARVTHRRAELAHMLHSDFERGVELYAEALELFRAAPHPPVGEVGILIDHYAGALDVLARHDKAVELTRWRLDYTESRLGPGHPQTGHGHLCLANSLMAAGEADEAQREAERALQILLDAGVPDSELAEIHSSLGLLAIAREDWATARVHVERKLELYVDAYGEQGVVSIPLKLLGELELRSGNPKLAKAHFERALAMSTESFGPENPWMEVMREALGDACMALEEFEQASELFALVIPRLQTIHGADTTLALSVMAKNLQAHIGLRDLDGARTQLAAIDAVEAVAENLSLQERVDVDLARAAFEVLTGARKDAKDRLDTLRATLSAEDGSPGVLANRARSIARVDDWVRENL